MARRRILRSKRRSSRGGHPDLKDPFAPPECVRVIDPWTGQTKEICPKGGGGFTSDLKDPFKGRGRRGSMRIGERAGSAVVYPRQLHIGARRVSMGRRDRYGVAAHMQRQRSDAYNCNDLCYRYCDWRFDEISDRNNNRDCHRACNNLCSSLASGTQPQSQGKRRRIVRGRLAVGRCYGSRYGGRY